MTIVSMSNVAKSFGSSVALADFSIEIESGELICLLGPSGCGKTTALRILAGFERADQGAILIDGEDITGLPPEKRGFGMVFQDYSLFPNMTARQNIEFGLKMKRLAARERQTTIDRMIEITRLSDHADKYPHQMSGGQKQRVALARAVATSPRLLLLDEPLSALDAKVRESLRDEIRRLQLEIGVTTVFVTHDQHEALAIADRVAVMSDGRLEQLAPPRELYENPANAFVAGFIGTVNTFAAHRATDGMWEVLGRTFAVADFAGIGNTAQAVVRPEQIALDSAGSGEAVIVTIAFLGALSRIVLSDPDLGRVVADILSADAGRLSVGDCVRIRVRDDVTDLVLIGDHR
jgi:putative spermidine/putrescine transport system ATP-binding protein